MSDNRYEALNLALGSFHGELRHASSVTERAEEFLAFLEETGEFAPDDELDEDGVPTQWAEGFDAGYECAESDAVEDASEACERAWDEGYDAGGNAAANETTREAYRRGYEASEQDYEDAISDALDSATGGDVSEKDATHVNGDSSNDACSVNWAFGYKDPELKDALADVSRRIARAFEGFLA